MRNFVGLKTACAACALCLMLAIALPAQTSSNNAKASDLGPNLIVNGDFSQGNTGFVSQYTYGNMTGPSTYLIAPNPSGVPGHYSDWCNFGTPSGIGKMFIANGGNSTTEIVWSETVAVTPGTEYTVSLAGATINTTSSSPAQLELEINGEFVVGVTLPSNCPAAGGTWVRLARHWTADDSGIATVVILDRNTNTILNDYVFDDVSLREVLGSAKGDH